MSKVKACDRANRGQDRAGQGTGRGTGRRSDKGGSGRVQGGIADLTSSAHSPLPTLPSPTHRSHIHSPSSHHHPPPTALPSPPFSSPPSPLLPSPRPIHQSPLRPATAPSLRGSAGGCISRPFEDHTGFAYLSSAHLIASSFPMLADCGVSSWKHFIQTPVK